LKDNYYFNDKYFLGIPFTAFQGESPPFVWFKPDGFRRVMDVCKTNGLGVAAIEVWKDGYAETVLVDEHGGDPFDATWYLAAFETLLKTYVADGEAGVLFAASYLETGDAWPTGGCR